MYLLNWFCRDAQYIGNILSVDIKYLIVNANLQYFLLLDDLCHYIKVT